MYFDIVKGINFVEYIKGLSTGKKTQQGDGYLYYHDSSLLNGADDNSYRYAGNNPNNFVCFGSTNTACPEENMYRIIGVFKIDNEYRVKLIKSEYISAEELGIIADNVTLSSFTSLARIQTTSGINGFHWNDVQATGKNWNDWETATLNQALNDTNTGYLSKLGTTWSSKIATSTWYVSGHSTNEVTARQMRDAEMNSSRTVPAQVGLMYASDYGFATTNDNGEWEQILVKYDNTGGIKNIENNWLFNGVPEWLISPDSSDSYGAFYVYNPGYVGRTDPALVNDSLGVRPSFYLEASVSVAEDENDGSHDKPYRIVLK